MCVRRGAGEHPADTCVAPQVRCCARGLPQSRREGPRSGQLSQALSRRKQCYPITLCCVSTSACAVACSASTSCSIVLPVQSLPCQNLNQMGPGNLQGGVQQCPEALCQPGKPARQTRPGPRNVPAKLSEISKRGDQTHNYSLGTTDLEDQVIFFWELFIPMEL